MNRDELIQIALRNQRHLALETPVEEIETLPDDLLTALVDCGNSEHYKLHGFLRAPRSRSVCSFEGVRVKDDRLAVLTGQTRIEIELPSGKKKLVLRSALKWDEEKAEWWYALVEGNGVILASELKAHGFTEAGASSLTHVEVRPA